MSDPTVTWSFRGVAGTNVQCPRALDAGIARIIGKQFDAQSGAYALAEPTSYTLSKREAAGLRGFFAKHLKLGQLLPADHATAAAFGAKEPA